MESTYASRHSFRENLEGESFMFKFRSFLLMLIYQKAFPELQLLADEGRYPLFPLFPREFVLFIKEKYKDRDEESPVSCMDQCNISVC